VLAGGLGSRPCEEQKLAPLVASTTGAAWQWKHIKRKTDRDDALKLARLAAVGEIDGVVVPPRVIRQWRSLIGLRKRLVSERVRGQNRIRGLLVCQGLPAPQGAKAWTAFGLAGIDPFEPSAGGINRLKSGGHECGSARETQPWPDTLMPPQVGATTVRGLAVQRIWFTKQPKSDMSEFHPAAIEPQPDFRTERRRRASAA